ncbi:MAG: DUF1599 domain-containing protein [Clostridia bacterium]|nr:DUF1599 domain-containing protein [Clostridia bacterium]
MLEQQFDSIISGCRSLFEKKMGDYGATWMFFRYESIADQLWIKIRRVRVLETNGGNALIPEGREEEFVGIINYAVIALMRLKMPELFPDGDRVMLDTALVENIGVEAASNAYAKIAEEAKALMIKKNHDYGDAWRSMDPVSITDQIIIKIYRIKNILKNGGKVSVSENIDAQLFDIINYSVFALIRAREGKENGERI